MKRLAIMLCLVAAGSVARAQDRGSLALDAGFGFSGDAVLYDGAFWHSWSLLPQPRSGRLAAYAGLGPRFYFSGGKT